MRRHVLLLLLLTSCQLKTFTYWEDIKTSSNHVMASLLGHTNQPRVHVENPGDLSDEYITLDEADLQDIPSEDDIPPPECEITKLRGNDIPYEKRSESAFKPLHFNENEYVIFEKADFNTLSNIVKHLSKNKSLCLIIEGHCDQQGSSSYNMALGMRRAQHIRALLKKRGIDPNRLYAVSYGDVEPLVRGKNPNNMYKNRRVQFKIVHN